MNNFFIEETEKFCAFSVRFYLWVSVWKAIPHKCAQR